MSHVTYRVLGHSFLEWNKGDEFEFDFNLDEDEADAIRSGLIEVVPGEYLVVGGSVVYGAQPGETFTEALPAYQVRQLIESGNIDPAPAASEKPAKDTIAKIEETTDVVELGELRAAEEARDTPRKSVMAALEKREAELAASDEGEEAEAG